MFLIVSLAMERYQGQLHVLFISGFPETLEFLGNRQRGHLYFTIIFKKFQKGGDHVPN